MSEKEQAKVPMTKMKAPEGASSCSVDGEQYDVNKDGTVEVPAAFVEHLAQHGYTVAPAPAVAKK